MVITRRTVIALAMAQCRRVRGLGTHCLICHLVTNRNEMLECSPGTYCCFSQYLHCDFWDPIGCWKRFTCNEASTVICVTVDVRVGLEKCVGVVGLVCKGNSYGA